MSDTTQPDDPWPEDPRPASPRDRYHRQRILEGFGDAGQERLGASHAVVVGLGALGSVCADLLARAGVGRLTLIDRDLVELTNLQRQPLYSEADMGVPKAVAAERRLASVNGSIRLHAAIADFDWDNAERLALDGPLGEPDCLIDGTDNFETRYLLNDLAVREHVPFVYAGAIGWRGMGMTILPKGSRAAGARPTPCLRCVFPDPPAVMGDTCDTAGVHGPAVAIAAANQASEAIKVLSGNADRCARSLLDFDLLRGRRRRVDLEASIDHSCPACAQRRFEFLDGAGGTRTHRVCGQNAVQVRPAAARREREIDLPALALRLRGVARTVVEQPFLLRAELDEQGEGGSRIGLTVFADARALVSGTTDPDRARGVYARYVGA